MPSRSMLAIVVCAILAIALKAQLTSNFIVGTAALGEGTLVYRETGSIDASVVAFIAGEVLHVQPGAGRVQSRDALTGNARTLFDVPARNGQSPQVLSLLPFVNGEAFVAVARYSADRKIVAYMRDTNRGARAPLETLYERPDDPTLTVEALDWSLANQVFLYEHPYGDVARLLGRTIAVTVFPRATVNLSERYGVRGVPSVNGGGKRVAFLVGPDDTLGQPYHIDLLDLQTGAKRTLYERFGTRAIVSDGRPTMTATRPRWTPDDRDIVFADTDRSADVAPMLIQVPVDGDATKRLERRIGTVPAEALDLLMGSNGTACVLMRETDSGRRVVVEVNLASGQQRTVLRSERLIRLVGIAP